MKLTNRNKSYIDKKKALKKKTTSVAKKDHFGARPKQLTGRP